MRGNLRREIPLSGHDLLRECVHKVVLLVVLAVPLIIPTMVLTAPQVERFQNLAQISEILMAIPQL